MKQVNDNEMDLLLRSLARGRDQGHSQGELGSQDPSQPEHLDADELNSYAEGVVPEPARARYLQHLADCAACRSMVVDLSQAAGAAARYEVPQPQGGSSFWQKIGALFSPAVLRFAVPALVLTIVIGIGFVALWQQRRNDLVAMHSSEESPPASVQPQNYDNPAAASTTATPPSSSSGASLDSGETKANKDLAGGKSVAPLEQVPPCSVTVAKPAPGKDDSRPGEDSDLLTNQPYAPEPKAGAPVPAPLSEVDKSGELLKERPEKREAQERRDAFRIQNDDEHGPSRARNNTTNTTSALPANQRGLGSISGGRGPSDADKKKVSSVETRSVSGRRFTRADDVWVDTAFDPSRATIRVNRGSEQFRVLAADEPGIRAIADQLSGVVIVVWKNRAYRIQ